MERVIIDMDEVIADPMGEMVGWYQQEYGLPVDYKKMLNNSWIAGFPPEHQSLIWERLQSPGFFRNLPVMADSIPILRDMNERYDIYIVSAATEFPNSLKDKLDWLLEHFPFFTWKQLVLCGDKRMVWGDHMIDDHARHLEHFNGKKYLFSSAHNLQVQGYTRIDSWKQAAGIFLPA